MFIKSNISCPRASKIHVACFTFAKFLILDEVYMEINSKGIIIMDLQIDK